MNIGLSKLLPFQLTEHFFRTHHAFPLLPLPHQPYQDIDATPCLQDQALLSSHNTNISPQSWYPANYTKGSPATTQQPQPTDLDQSSSSILSATSSNSLQPQLTEAQKGVNRDPVTRRLSLCSHNGEWKAISKTGATPSPIWNPFEGIKVNFSLGFEM